MKNLFSEPLSTVTAICVDQSDQSSYQELLCRIRLKKVFEIHLALQIRVSVDDIKHHVRDRTLAAGRRSASFFHRLSHEMN